jgi:hypothetical protein
MQFGYQIPGDMGHIVVVFSQGETWEFLRCDCPSPRQIQRTLRKNCSADLECTVLTINSSTAWPYKFSAEVIQCAQTSIVVGSNMLSSEDVKLRSQRPVQLPGSEVRHACPIDCPLGSVFARRRGLGILSLARLARLESVKSQQHRLYPLSGVVSAWNSGDRFPSLFSGFMNRVTPHEVSFSLRFSGKPRSPCIRVQSCAKFSNSTT